MSEDGGAAQEVHPGASHREGEPRRRVLRQELLRLWRGSQGQPGNDRGGGEWRRRSPLDRRDGTAIASD